MEGRAVERKSRRSFRLGVGVLGATLLVSLAYSQLSSDTYGQASARTRQLQARMDSFLSVRGKINRVVEAVSDSNLHFANPSLAIDQRVWNLQSAWTDFRDEQPFSEARLVTPSPSALDAAVDQFALAALRNGIALRKGIGTAQSANQMTAGLDPHLTAMESQIARAMESAAAQRDSALAGIGYGRSLAYGSFFALASLLLAGMLVSGLRGFKEWMGRAPVAINADKFASPQR